MGKADRGKITGRDVSASLSVALAAFGAFYCLSGGGVDPTHWRDVSIAAGIVPPTSLFPGLWRAAVSWLPAKTGIGTFETILSVAGAAAGAFCVFLAGLIARQTMAFLISADEEHPVWEKRIVPFFSAAAALLLAAADPMWTLFQTLSSDGFRFMMLMSAVYLWMRWLSVGGGWRLYPLVAISAMLAAESPIGFLLPIVFIAGYYMLWRRIENGHFVPDESLPEPSNLPKWRMFFLFAAVMWGTVWLNVKTFADMGGLEATGMAPSKIYFLYGASYARVFVESSTLIGWVLGLGFGWFPLLVAARVFPAAVRDDRAMPFRFGMLLMFVGFLALLQSGAFTSTRFWALLQGEPVVPSGFLLATHVFCSLLTLSLVGAAFAFECQRTYLSAEYDEPPKAVLRYLAPGVAAVVLGLAVFHAWRGTEMKMRALVSDALDEIIKEAGDAKWIFTDGQLDDGLRLAVAVEGKGPQPLSMMSGGAAWDRYIRARWFEKESADYSNALMGVPVLFRVWAGEKPGGMDESAIQLGLEFWTRARKEPPKASGLLAREKGLSDEAAADGIERAKELAERIVELSPKIAEASPSPALMAAFNAVSWRISRFARLRDDVEIADKLDSISGIITRLVSMVEYERERAFMQFTPMEGLRIALWRRNFDEARRFASMVLGSDPDNPEANFAMGMSSLERKQMEDAERYLRRCLKRSPDEPAVINNLSIICRKAKRYEEAEQLARRALELLPNSPEVQQTLKDALEKAP